MSINKFTATIHNAWLRLKSEDRGASVVEWVLITLLVVGIVVAASALISQAIDTKAQQVSTDIGNVGSKKP